MGYACSLLFPVGLWDCVSTLWDGQLWHSVSAVFYFFLLFRTLFNTLWCHSAASLSPLGQCLSSQLAVCGCGDGGTLYPSSWAPLTGRGQDLCCGSCFSPSGICNTACLLGSESPSPTRVLPALSCLPFCLRPGIFRTLELGL